MRLVKKLPATTMLDTQKLRLNIKFVFKSPKFNVQCAYPAVLNCLNVTGVYIRLMFTSRERKRRIYTPVL